MPLDDSSILQAGSGTATSTPFTATLPSGTTALSTVLIWTATTLAATSSAGMTADAQAGSLRFLNVWRKSDETPGTSSWAFTMAAGVAACWVCYEVAGLDLAAPLVGVALSGDYEGQSTFSTGVTGTVEHAPVLAVAAHAIELSGTAAATWSAQTNGYAESHDVNISGVNSNKSLAVARRFPAPPTDEECTATVSLGASAGDYGQALLVVYKASGASGPTERPGSITVA